MARQSTPPYRLIGVKTRTWIPRLAPQPETFRLRHAVGWLVYLALLWWALEFFFESRRDGGFSLLPAMLFGWAAVFTGGPCLDAWLDGARRSRLFRIALVATALVSCALWGWMLWLHVMFLFAGTASFFKTPFALISLAVVGEGVLLACGSIVAFAIFIWATARIALALLMGRQVIDTEHAISDQLFADPPPAPVEFVPAPAARFNVAPEQAARDEIAAMPRSELPPPSAPIRLAGLAFIAGGDAATRARVEAIGWPTLEGILRSSASAPALAQALQALPHLAGALDEAGARAVRERISKLADHAGAFEVALPLAEIRDPALRTRTVRVADVALQALLDWDAERARHASRA